MWPLEEKTGGQNNFVIQKSSSDVLKDGRGRGITRKLRQRVALALSSAVTVGQSTLAALVRVTGAKGESFGAKHLRGTVDWPFSFMT